VGAVYLNKLSQEFRVEDRQTRTRNSG